MFSLSDDVQFFTPTSIPEPITPPTTTVNPRDIVRQDALIGSYFQSSLGNTDTDVTYVSQYATPSTLLDTPVDNVDDAFLTAMPCVPPATTQHEFAKPTGPPPSRITKSVQKPNPRATKQFVINPSIPSQKQVTKNTNVRSHVSKNRSTCARTTSRHLMVKTGSQTLIKPPAQVSILRNNTTGDSSNNSKPRSYLLINRTGSATTSSRIDSLRSATHTRVTDSADAVSQSPLGLTSENFATVAQGSSQYAGANLNDFTTRSQNWAKTETQSSYHATSTITSQSAANQDNVLATTKSTQSTYAVPLYPSPMIIARPISPTRSGDTTHIRSLTPSSTSEKHDVDCTVVSTDTNKRLSSRIIIPVTLSANSEGLSIVTTSSLVSHTNSKPRVCATMRVTQSIPSVTHAQTFSTSASTAWSHRAYSVVPTRSTCTIPPGAALYAPATTPSEKTSRLRAVPVTTASKTFTIDTGSHTTLKISSDIGQTTIRNSVTTQNDNVRSASDSTIRSRSQLLIPIVSTTGISYLMTSPISSLPEATQAPSNSAAAGTHITNPIRSDTSNKTRARIILPVAQNVPSTVVGLNSSMDSNRSRNTLAIISPRISSSVNTSDNTTISTIRAFAIAKPQNTFLSHDIDRVTRSRTSTEISEPANSDDLSSVTTLLSSNLTSSSIATSEPVARPLNRIFVPFLQNASNINNSATVKPASSHITTCVLTPSTYILTSGIGTSANSTSTTQKPSQRLVIPLIQSSAITVTSTTTSTTRPTANFMSSTGTMSGSRLRNRLLVPTVSSSIDNDISDASAVSTSSITSYTITKGRATAIPQSGVSRSSESFNPKASTAMHNVLAPNAAYASFTTTTVGSTVKTPSRSPFSTPSGEVTICKAFTPATTTLTSAGPRYVLKLAVTQSVTASSNMRSSPITTSVSTPPNVITPKQRTGSKLRTFPGPRTYATAQRNISKPERTTNPRPVLNKRIVTAPSPLQIFPDIVSPQTTTNLAITATTQNNSGPRFTLSQSSGSSTLIIPQYKNTVFKNLSTIAHPLPTARLPTTQASAERLVLRRSVTCVAPRRSFPNTHNIITQRAPASNIESIRSRLIFNDTLLRSPRATPSPDPAAQSTSQPDNNALPFNASDNTRPIHDDQSNEN